MRKILTGVLCALSLAACDRPSGAEPANSPAPSDREPKQVSGLELEYFDRSVRPQDDLYGYVNGRWLVTTRIPPDKSNYGAFTALADQAEADLRAIIEEAAAEHPRAGTEAQKIGDMYTSFMDEPRLNQLGDAPLENLLAKIEALESKDALPEMLANLNRIGVYALIGFFINQDAKDSTQYAAWFVQTGLGLPDRDYYLSDDEKFADIRKAYVAHITRVLRLAGDEAADAHAGRILAFETALARAHWTRIESRDDDLTYNKLSIEELAALTPGFDWQAYLDTAGLDVASVIVMQPSAYAGAARLLAETSLAELKTYLTWHVLSEYAPYLSKAFVDENFAFYGKTLRGTEELPARWKRGVRLVEESLGEAVGKIYVERHFPPAAKARMEKLVDNLKLAYRQSISDLDWMSENTKAKALTKLSKFTTKIGYPDKWKDYAKLEVKADDLVGNLMRARVFEYERELAKFGQPIDREEWHMTPQTVNAYYNPGMNEIVFPAAILQPPFFNFEAEDAVNYGGIGAVIGHEIGHGFDDQGSKYDGDGNLQSWWIDADRESFEARTQALIEQYDRYCPLNGQCVQGALTIGENIGDLGGLSIAYKAYQLALGGKAGPEMDGFTADQRVFLGWAQIWRRKYREPELLNRLKTDPHSPSEYRCNGVVKNVDAFYSAFDVDADDALFLPPAQRVSIW